MRGTQAQQKPQQRSNATAGHGTLGRTGAAVLREDRNPASSAQRHFATMPAAGKASGARMHTPPTQAAGAAATMRPGGRRDAELEGEEKAHQADNTVRRQPREVPRWYSVQSQGALSQLAAVEVEVHSVQLRVEELAAMPLDSEEQRGAVRAELAQLEAQAHKLECQGVDNVYTNDLDSGKADAKDLKKALLARLENVLELVERTFQRLKEQSKPAL
mmetsp:Transcript_9524/g.22796  ORF Transcript_9524/g.22796 Transcript_9524/m.22796 type:complete len:217 (-) Transcript_9524:156-806(-)